MPWLDALAAAFEAHGEEQMCIGAEKQSRLDFAARDQLRAELAQVKAAHASEVESLERRLRIALDQNILRGRVERLKEELGRVKATEDAELAALRERLKGAEAKNVELRMVIEDKERHVEASAYHAECQRRGAAEKRVRDLEEGLREIGEAAVEQCHSAHRLRFNRPLHELECHDARQIIRAEALLAGEGGAWDHEGMNCLDRPQPHEHPDPAGEGGQGGEGMSDVKTRLCRATHDSAYWTTCTRTKDCERCGCPAIILPEPPPEPGGGE